ncbi:MAG: helix-turn-helix domain-containing protein, partial [Candidatus Acidiferrales bacterium]
ENTIERAMALESARRISADALPERVRTHAQELVPKMAHNGNGLCLPEDGVNLEEHIAKLERAYLLAALERSGGVRTRAADLLEMSYRSFRHYAKKYGV